MMSGDFFRQPVKTLEREFRALGAKCLSRDRAGIRYAFPDGAVYLIPEGVSPGRAITISKSVHDRYATDTRHSSGNPLRSAVQKAGAPKIIAEQLIMSRHAHSRLALMKSQARLDPVEITDALLWPERVLWSPIHESWMWVRGRVIVTAGINEDESIVIRTILWATEDLWEQNPRPKGDG